MKHFPDKDLTFKLGDELDGYNFTLEDSIQDIFNKYYSVDQVDPSRKERLISIIDMERPVNGMCHAFEQKFPHDQINPREDLNTH